MITKLGPNLGISKCKIPAPEPPPKLSPGVFDCLHQCKGSFPAGLMLAHIRKSHGTKLIENVRSNPYSGRFDWMFNITLTTDMKYIVSIQVSDMGLFTVTITLIGNNIFGYVQTLGDDSISSLYLYQLTARITKEKSSCNAFTATNCKVSNYKNPVKDITASGHCLRIHRDNLLGLVNDEDQIQIMLSIWKANSKKNEKEFSPQTLIPEVPVVFSNDRKIRRNRNRNMRKKRLKENLRLIKKQKGMKEGGKESNEPLVNAMSNLKIVSGNK